MAVFDQGDFVPAVGIAKTYAVRLNALPSIKPKYLWVHDLKITAVMAHQPIEKAPVFSKWGEYLGTGGEELDVPRVSPVEEATKAMMGVIDKQVAKDVKPPRESARRVRTYGHEFQLRDDWKVTLELPIDLTLREVERLSDWVRVLSFQSG